MSRREDSRRHLELVRLEEVVRRGSPDDTGNDYDAKPSLTQRSTTPKKAMSKQLLSDFRYVIFALIIMVILSSFSHALAAMGIFSPYDLGASRSQPEGILISLFVHSGFIHYLVNMVGMILFTVFFILINACFSSRERRRRGNFFVFIIFVAAIAANTLFVIFIPVTTIGSSGIVFAMVGSTFGFATVQVTYEVGIYTDRRKGRVVEGHGLSKRWFMISLLLFVSTLSFIAIRPEEFLFVREGVNYFIHGVAFLVAFVVTLFYGHIALHRYLTEERTDTMRRPV